MVSSPTGAACRLPSWSTSNGDQVDFRTATLHFRRVKKGTPSTHPVLGDELRALRRLQREQEPKSPFGGLRAPRIIPPACQPCEGHR